MPPGKPSPPQVKGVTAIPLALILREVGTAAGIALLAAGARRNG